MLTNFDRTRETEMIYLRFRYFPHQILIHINFTIFRGNMEHKSLRVSMITDRHSDVIKSCSLTCQFTKLIEEQ